MAVRDKNIAIWRNYHSRRPIECIWSIAGDAGLAESHQNFSVGAELENLVPLSVFARIVARGHASDSVGHPHVSVLVRKDSVRKDEHSRAEILKKLPRRIEFENGSKVGIRATVSAASVIGPDVAVRANRHSRS